MKAICNFKMFSSVVPVDVPSRQLKMSQMRLIMDSVFKSASTRVRIQDYHLANVKLQLLHPNTTSKIQPMDAGIIAAFKRRYRRYHLQNAIDCDERGEARTIYKVDQITPCAGRWLPGTKSWPLSLPTAPTTQGCFRIFPSF